MYIDIQYIEALLSPAQVDALKTYGLNPAASGSAKVNTLISGACSTIDGFIAPAGYSVPLGDPPEMIKRIAGFRVLYDLYMLNGVPVPIEIKEEVGIGENLLIKINQEKITLPGKESVDNGPKFYSTVDASLLSVSAMTGSY